MSVFSGQDDRSLKFPTQLASNKEELSLGSVGHYVKAACLAAAGSFLFVRARAKRSDMNSAERSGEPGADSSGLCTDI